ncbi:MAG: hypothetical protein LBG48_04710 [Rickettsiales bacterium]|jgi:hypoxanthine phosphoribosyltransferase|nr:hypothetical protein [Rickettsiales bacterium]
MEEGPKTKDINYKEIIEGCYKIAEEIRRENPNTSEIDLVAVARGGLIPALIVAHILEIKPEKIKIFKAASYDDNTRKRGGIIAVPVDNIKNSPNTYFMEEVLDTGATVSYIKGIYPEVKIAALVSKRRNDKNLWRAGIIVPKDEWIIFPWEEKKDKFIHDGCDEIRRQCSLISDEIRDRHGLNLSKVQLVTPVGSSLMNLTHVANYTPTKNVYFVRPNEEIFDVAEDGPYTYCVCNPQEVDFMGTIYPKSNIRTVDNIFFVNFLMQKVDEYVRNVNGKGHTHD